ncbi:MAG: hypothetical protein LBP27_00695 [Treponema sp.]|jgi:hypothetical protein|nr:hypothetical protein [Treponema sp.]
MKKFFVLVPAVLFALIACKTDDYPSFVYTNTSPYDISFKTYEEDSPEYRLKGKDGTKSFSMTLDSGVRGRAEINGTSLKPAYTDWRRAGNDIYSIEFFERDAVTVRISNTTDDKITLSEKRGFLKPEKPEIEPAKDQGEVKETEAVIYTKTPSFEISGNTYPAGVDFRMADDVMYVLISRR